MGQAPNKTTTNEIIPGETLPSLGCRRGPEPLPAWRCWDQPRPLSGHRLSAWMPDDCMPRSAGGS